MSFTEIIKKRKGEKKVYEKKKVTTRRALLLWKPLLSYPLGQSLRLGVPLQFQDTSQLQKKPQQGIRLPNIRQLFKPIFWIVAVFRPRNRALWLYGKNRFSIRFQKTGKDLIWTVYQEKTPGEMILNTSVQRARLCRQRFLKICPISSDHLGRTKKKEAMVMAPISSPGSKVTFAGGSILLFVVMGLLLSSFCLKTKAELRLWSKNYEVILLDLDEKNKAVILGEVNDKTC